MWYDDERVDDAVIDPRNAPFCALWLLRRFGRDFCRRVIRVDLERDEADTDVHMVRIASLTELRN